jgi:hypothetical protein
MLEVYHEVTAQVYLNAKAQSAEHYGNTKQAAILWTEQNGDSKFVAPGGVNRPQNTKKNREASQAWRIRRF